MAFEQDLRVYLEGLEVHEHGSPAEVAQPLRRIDEHELHRHLLDRLRALENAGSGAIVQQLFSQWRSKLARFARYLETLPKQLAPMDRDEAIAFARRALDAAIGHPDLGIPLVDRLELQRIVDGFVGGDALFENYALENHLVRGGHRHRPKLTEMGRVFLRLRGKDAVRWLVTGEVVQSTGPYDPWHTSHELLAEAATTRGITPQFEDNTGYFGYNNATLNRLTSFGVLVMVLDRPNGVALEFHAEATMRDVVEAILEPGPWHTTVRALLDDERALVLPGSSSSATEATIEQTKLIVHEVRNTLIPVRHDIEALRPLAVEHAQQQRIDDAKQGIARVLDFVDAMVQMSELITEPAVHCDIGAVVDEALGWIDIGRRVARTTFSGAIHVRAPRARLARAISNVVGNALQATPASRPVRLSIEHGKGVARVLVDDGGPGVPVEDRARVFLEGVTMRPDGTGSGFGLAFARRVVEGGLHGKIWCEDSDLGGARFVIEVPEASPG